MMRNQWQFFNRKRRRGSVIVQTVAFGSTVAVGVAALAIDSGLMFSAKQELQTAADAAALAAAAKLGTNNGDPFEAAKAEAQKYANQNRVMGEHADLVDSDVLFGHAEKSGDKFVFQAGVEPLDAVKVTLRRDQTVADGPVSLFFGKVLGVNSADIQASATAMIVPRDIAVVVDLSGSMNDDSEFFHSKQFQSERSGTIDGVQINIEKIWGALPVATSKAGILNGNDPNSPSSPEAGDQQPGNGSGSPTQAGASTSGQTGPRWGWMTEWGKPVVLGPYDATTDGGLYYIKKGSTTTDADVIANLTEAGYSSDERSAILSSSNDGNSGLYRNRVKVMLGLAGWRSGRDNPKYTNNQGDGDSKVESWELTQEVSYPYNNSSWNSWIDYVRSSNARMVKTDPDLRYRYGIKTFTNYLLEKKPGKHATPELQAAPEEPLFSVKNAVGAMIDEIIRMGTDDHVSLETFAQYGNHRMDLTVPATRSELPVLLAEISENLMGYQAAYETSVTNIGAGMDKALSELNSERARGKASRYIVILTDGKPNVNSSNSYVGNNNSQAIGWALDRAEAAREQHITVFTIGVGGDVNEQMLIDMATSEDKYYYADNNPDPNNDGAPLYVNQLQEIFRSIAGRTPVQLIQ